MFRSPGMAGPLMQPCLQNSGSITRPAPPGAMLSNAVQNRFVAADRDHAFRPAGRWSSRKCERCRLPAETAGQASGPFVKIALFASRQVDLVLLEPLGKLGERQHAIDQAFVLRPFGLGLLRQQGPMKITRTSPPSAERPADMAGVGQHG